MTISLCMYACVSLYVCVRLLLCFIIRVLCSTNLACFVFYGFSAFLIVTIRTAVWLQYTMLFSFSSIWHSWAKNCDLSANRKSTKYTANIFALSGQCNRLYSHATNSPKYICIRALSVWVCVCAPLYYLCVCVCVCSDSFYSSQTTVKLKVQSMF